MTGRQFAWQLRTRGPCIAGWPQREQAAALNLLRQDLDARQALAEALASEATISADHAGLARMQGSIRRALTPIPTAMRWAGVAACAAAGIYLGTLAGAEPISGPVPTMQATLSSALLAAAEP